MTTPTTAQPAAIQANGTTESPTLDKAQSVAPGKRKRDVEEEDDRDEDMTSDEQKPAITNGEPKKDQRDLIRSFVEALSSYDVAPSILKRPLPESSDDDDDEDDHRAKRQKSTDPSTISDKATANAYENLDQVADDLVSAIHIAFKEIKTQASNNKDGSADDTLRTQITEFKDRAMELLRREKAYPKVNADPLPVESKLPPSPQKGTLVLSLVGYAPQEKRLFSSLPASAEANLRDLALPAGLSLTHVMPTTSHERAQTLGDLFSSPRSLPPLQPPKQPKTQAKGNTLDFYRPELTDNCKLRNSSYFTTKLSAGCYLDYSNATPSSQTMNKQRERAQSLAGKRPSTTELELSEMESLFRGAFSSFAPCKDDSGAVVPSSVAGRMWWQRSGHKNFQNMIEVNYYGDGDNEETNDDDGAMEIDEKAIQEAIDNWDESVVDPSLEEALGTKRTSEEKEVDEILEEVSDLIETLSSYQRIRNLNLPNSQNRSSSDPVTGDMLATPGPTPSEGEQATYQVLKAQLALIIKTLPPYAVAKLNGDQLEDLLISTKVQVQTDGYKGVMEEDEAGVQARLRAQQQAAQVSARPPPQRTPSISGVSYGHHTPQNQYATPQRAPSMSQQQYYRPGPTPSFQPQPQPQPRPMPSQARPQPTQYSRPNGYPAQYATQVAKAQTPYGHQNMPQYASQQRPQFGQMPAQPATPSQRYPYQPGYPQQQVATPAQPNFGVYTNGQAIPQRTMSPVVNRQAWSASPNTVQQQQPPRYGTPNQAAGNQINRYPSNPPQQGTPAQNPGLTGYHTVIPEAQQQRILDQAKARVAAQERSAMFTDKIAQPGTPGYGIGNGQAGVMDANRLAAARASIAAQQKPPTPNSSRSSMNGTPGPPPPHKVTPVPVPPIPGMQHKPSQ